MPVYILSQNKRDSKSGHCHELHEETPGVCDRLPDPVSRLELGTYANCIAALDAARWMYPQYKPDINGCEACCPDCHTEQG